MGWAISPALPRAVAFGLLALSAAACATAPAPVAQHRPAPAPRLPAPLPDPNGGPRIVDGGPLQCVPYARNASGVQIFGDANTWWTQAAGRYPRSNVPAPGSVLVMRGYRDPTRGHVAVVTAIVSPREIRVDQANWFNGGEISLAVPVIDVSPNNDWTEVRVWYIPTNSWGARVYQADGFIHPFAFQMLVS